MSSYQISKLLQAIHFPLLLFILIYIPFDLSATTEEEKIHFLINQIVVSESRFIRNGIEYSGAEAKSHLEKKYEYAKSQIKTVEDFIENIASKSSMTGNAYQVKTKDGKIIDAKVWLKSQLKYFGK